MQATQKEIDLIYKHTHKDYKSILNGTKCILSCITGATSLIPIESLPPHEFDYQIKRARSKEACHATKWGQ